MEEIMAEYADQYVMREDETLADLLNELAEQNAETLRVFAEADLDTPVPVPHDVPWFPQDIDNWSVRWVALHLIEELARHAGHADIIRETIDSATMYELMAANEGWPETDFIKRWRPRQEPRTSLEECRPEAGRRPAGKSSSSTKTSATPQLRLSC